MDWRGATEGAYMGHDPMGTLDNMERWLVWVWRGMDANEQVELQEAVGNILECREDAHTKAMRVDCVVEDSIGSPDQRG